MIFNKQALLALGVACAARPFSRVGAVSVRGDENSPLDAFARKLGKKLPTKESTSKGGLPYVGGPKTPKEDPSNSKGGKNPPNSSKAYKEEQNTPSFFVASAACAQKCISAEFGPDTHLLTNAIQHCDAQSSRQMWDVLQDGAFVKVRSVDASADSTNGGLCLGVVPQVSGGLGLIRTWGFQDADYFSLNKMDVYADTLTASIPGLNAMVTDMLFLGGDGYEDHDMCSNGSKLGLVSCDHPSSQWYSTDGQLISPFCWGSVGLSSFLSVNEGCTDLHLSTTSDGASAISRAETFMAVTQAFIETIPPPPAPTFYPTDNPTTATDTPIDAPMEPTSNPTTATYTPTVCTEDGNQCRSNFCYDCCSQNSETCEGVGYCGLICP